ncbi:hypothetical protein Taro_030511 [Colocasia esculenta]|uniref:EF-hand domain-containing protein n=1 Tax=Colocasia esculenta TaxID=4460 RepID=A0A843W0G6_COLES|nr:hypothetical protein [Colocasia esculenta]
MEREELGICPTASLASFLPLPEDVLGARCARHDLPCMEIFPYALLLLPSLSPAKLPVKFLAQLPSQSLFSPSPASKGCKRPPFLESLAHPLYKATHLHPTAPNQKLSNPPPLSLSTYLNLLPLFLDLSFSVGSSTILHLSVLSQMASNREVAAPAETMVGGDDFEDYLPVMAERLGGDGLLEELCAGFRLLADPRLGLITFESLKRNAAALGLEGLSDGELMGMLEEGDMDGDGALDQMEFCVLMFRLSPELMDESRRVVDEALQHELMSGRGFFFS